LWEKLAAKLWFRISFGILVPAAFAFGAFYLRKYGNPFPCVFYEILKINCPGCGTGRAYRHLLNFQFLDAMDDNILAVICLPFLAYYLMKTYISVVIYGGRLKVFGRMPIKWYNAIMFAIILFWVLRNIPIYPFCLLSPWE